MYTGKFLKLGVRFKLIWSPIAWSLVRYGINFGQPILNQGAAMVSIYTDGSVLISHGGVEMGQGLHTKVCQIAAQVLGVPVGLVHITDTATDRVPNSSPSAASVSTDLYGGAVLKACKELRARLAPFVTGEPSRQWKVRRVVVWEAGH